MIQKLITFTCPRCGSDQLVKNGHNKVGSQQAYCHACRAYFVLEPTVSYTKRTKRMILKAYLERWSLGGLERIFGVTRPTIATWLKSFIRSFPPLRQTLRKARADDGLEVDEAWSFVGKKVSNAGCGP
jgi:insertion element IS1 protein InsB